jgi:beta-N-acetylhexosaminidase
MNFLPGQLIIMGIPGFELNDSLRDFIKRIQPGGFILFARNLHTAEQVYQLNKELNELCKEPPIITIDQEGGRVSRLAMVAERPPSAHELRLTGDVGLCREHGELNGKLMSLFGINLDLAPVVDYSPDDNADNSLKGRCFGRNPEETMRNAEAFLKGIQTHGVGGTVKHFPGYTFCGVDPHGELPLVDRSLKQLEENELRVFQHFVPLADSFMIGHGFFPIWHKESMPASLSPVIVNDLLRKKMGYEGLIMTDDLEMGAIYNHYGTVQSTKMAIHAGEDILLICHNPACVEISYDTLCSMPKEEIQPALDRVAKFKKKLPAFPKQFDKELLDELNLQIRDFRDRVQNLISIKA